MHSAQLPRVVSYLGIAVLLATPLACSKSDEAAGKESSPAAETKAEAGKTADGKTPAGERKGSDGLAQVVRDTATAEGGRLDRGDALGHFVVPNASRLLEEVRTQAAPPKGAAFLNEASLRGLAGMGLGARSGLSQHVVLDQPMGCVLVDDASVDVPVACMVGYQGGAAAAATDLGSEGKQADAAGHVAHYVIDGNDLYLDDMGGHVVVTNHASLFAKAQVYLKANIIGRGPSISDDVEVVMYPKALMGRYSKQVESLVSMMRGTPPVPASNPFGEAFTEYTRASTERSFDYYRELDQLDMGLGLEPVGFVFRYAIYPTAGSTAQADSQAIASGPIDPTLVQQLPAESWMVTASTIDWKAAWQLESAATMRDVVTEAYAKAVGRDAAAVRTVIESFLEENSTLYGRDFATALVHLPGTQGGLVMSRKLSAPARAQWKPWADGFDPATVLGPEGEKAITWSFQPDALVVDGIAVDRWTIEPGPESKAKIAAKADPVIAEIERRFGGLKLEIDRVELDDRVMFVVAPGAQERYIRAAIMAAKGGPSSGSDAGLRSLLARNPDTSLVMAFDVAGALGWLREVMPPAESGKLPKGLGADLSDFYVSGTYGASGRQHGEMVLSQAMIDGLRKLAG